MTREAKERKSNRPEHDVPAPQPEPVEEVLEEVARDASQRPKRFLRDSRVPEGGE